MPNQIAALLFTTVILGLFFLDWKQKANTSAALWLPIVYVLIIASRPVSTWLGVGPTVSVSQASEGSPVDRVVFALLQGMALAVLIQRGSVVTRILNENRAVVVFFLYCGLSILWSDFPDVAIKRWIKLVGDLMMVLIVVTDPTPAAALRRFLCWPAFILIPVSVLFIKYYLHLGRGYDPWTGAQMVHGISYNKNGLGVICLLWGLGCFWMLVDKTLRTRRRWIQILPPLVILLMAVWVLLLSRSATSMACLAAGTVLMVVSKQRWVAQRSVIIHMGAAAFIGLSFAALFLKVGTSALDMLQRDSTLTGRTKLWDDVLLVAGNPVLGVGYESFWLGERIDTLWQVYWWRPTQAHNGYLEIYLNLGWVGLVLLMVMIVTGYRKAISAVRCGKWAAHLRLALIVVIIPYNYTEAVFRMQNPPWVFLLLAIIGIPAVDRMRRTRSSPSARLKTSRGDSPVVKDAVMVDGHSRMRAFAR